MTLTNMMQMHDFHMPRDLSTQGQWSGHSCCKCILVVRTIRAKHCMLTAVRLLSNDSLMSGQSIWEQQQLIYQSLPYKCARMGQTWQSVLAAWKLTVTGKKDSGRVLGTTNSSDPVRLLSSIMSIDHNMMDLRASYRQSPSTLHSQQKVTVSKATSALPTTVEGLLCGVLLADGHLHHIGCSMLRDQLSIG